FKRADRLGCVAAVVIGDDELARGAVVLKDLKSGTQTELPRADLVARLKA
ncbi:His/Gly/Thr/Pro-type tRNA ligase C-terminal domain-containing protein, partial [Ferrovibrio sp.]